MKPKAVEKQVIDADLLKNLILLLENDSFPIAHRTLGKMAEEAGIVAHEQIVSRRMHMMVNILETLHTFDAPSKAKFLFILSYPLPEDREIKRDISAAGTVTFNHRHQITKFVSNDGAIMFEGRPKRGKFPQSVQNAAQKKKKKDGRRNNRLPPRIRLQDQTPINVNNQQNSAESVATPSIDDQSVRSNVYWNANVTDSKTDSNTSSQAGKKRARASGTLAQIKLDAKRRSLACKRTATEKTKTVVTRRYAAQRRTVVNQVESDSESDSEGDDVFEDEEVERDDDDGEVVPDDLEKIKKRKTAEEKERLEKQKFEKIKAKKAKSRQNSNSALPQSQDVVDFDDQETEKDDSGPSTSGIIYPHQIAAMHYNAPPAKKYKATTFSFPSTPSQIRNDQPPALGRKQSTPQHTTSASGQPATTFGRKPIVRISDVPVFTGSFQATATRQQGNQPNTSSRCSLNLPPASVSRTTLPQSEHDPAVRDRLTVTHVDQPAPPKEVNFNKFPVKQIPHLEQQHGGAPQQKQAQRQAQPEGVDYQRQSHQQQPFQHLNLLEQMQLTLRRQQASKSTYRPILHRPVAAATVEVVQPNPSDPRPQYLQPFQKIVPHSPPVSQAPQNIHRQAPRQNQIAVTSQQIHQQMPRSEPRSTHPQASTNGSQQIQAPRNMQNSHVNPQQAGQTPENQIVIGEPASMQVDPVDPELREYLVIPKNIVQQQQRCVSPTILQQIVPPQRKTDVSQKVADKNPPQNMPQEVPPNDQEPQEVQPLTPSRAPEQVQSSPQVPAQPETVQQNLRETAPLLYAELTGQPTTLVTVPENFQHKDLRKDLFPLQAMHRFEARPELPTLQNSNNATCHIPKNKTNDYMKWDRDDLLNWGKMFLGDIGQREMKKLHDDNIDGSVLSNMFDADARSQLPKISSGTFFKIRNNAAAVVNRYNELRFKHDTALFGYMKSQTQ